MSMTHAVEGVKNYATEIYQSERMVKARTKCSEWKGRIVQEFQSNSTFYIGASMALAISVFAVTMFLSRKASLTPLQTVPRILHFHHHHKLQLVIMPLL